jgi:hypothetical protein
MKVLGVPADAWSQWWSAAAATVPSWSATISALLLVLTYRLLAEWQRRTTLVELMKVAPAGTLIVQERGFGGPAMWIQIGGGAPRQAPSALPWRQS